MRLNKLIFTFAILCFQNAFAETFVEKNPIYGVIKPAEITTLLAVNHGMVANIIGDEGDKVTRGKTIITVIEKETMRPYRTTITGHVAKVHVTNGAAVTPGMPLITVINDKKKKVQVSLSPKEAQSVQVGADVFLRNSDDKFGHISKISPLVDPDTGAVISYIKPLKKVSQLIGDIIPLEIAVKTIDDCKIVPIKEVDQYIKEYKVHATSGNNACLQLKQ